jgi:hypothetical protein
MAIFLFSAAHAQDIQSRTVLLTRLPDAVPSAVDSGPIPSSQRLSLTLTLTPDPAKSAALDQFLTDVANPSSPSYHKWLTPRQFAASYGASPDRIAGATAWLESQGLSVDAVSPSGNRIAASGFASQIEAAFAVTLHNYQVNGALYFANAVHPSLPAGAAPLFSAIAGLDDLPDTTSLAAIAGTVDANATPILSLSTLTAASGSDIAGFTTLFRQASAQGITILAPAGAAFAEVTAIALPGAASTASKPFAQRPAWQAVVGLPADTLRYAPDLTASSLTAFAQALAGISLQTGGRLGNINPVLYALAPTPGLFTQPDNAAPATWEPATGLGVIDTAKFAQAYPRGTGTSTLSITTSAYAPVHGQTFTLTVTSTSTNGGPIPTGTVTFTAPQAGFTAGSAALNASGTAVSPAYLLPGGSYNISAAYSGDANYAPQTSSIAISVQPEAAIFAITAPASVSLGSTLTATVTLTSASGVGTPNASVTVTPSGISGAQAVTQTVSGTGGSASTTYTFTTKQAGSVSLQASCTSNDASFTCYTPQTSNTTVPQATPSVVLTITPTNPVAGTPVTLNAAVTGIAGIGPTGSVQFYDGTTSVGFGSAPNASFSGTLSAGANHSLTAVYQGDSNYLKATSAAVTATVNTAPTTTTVNASASTASFGQSVTLNVTVASPSNVNGTQPTGTLTFTGAGSVTSAPVSGGSANVTLNDLTVGTWTIGTSYSGDTNYSASTGNTVVIVVTQATASLNASLSSTSFTTGSTSTLTATITLPGNAQLPANSTFIATIAGVTGATYTGTFAVNAGGNTGTGAVTIPAPIAGSYTLQVTCGTNANFTCVPASLSISSTATSGGGGGTASALTASLSPVSALPGTTSTLTATATATAGTVPVGTITATVQQNSTTIATYTGTLPGTGIANTATIKIPIVVPATPGAYTVAVTCTGSNFTCTAVNLTLISTNTPGKLPTATTLAVVPSATVAGATVLTATVASTLAVGSLAPTGTVTFFDGTTQIGTGLITTSSTTGSTATLTLNNLSSNTTHSLTAVYSGDINFAASTSTPVTSLNTAGQAVTVTLVSNVATTISGNSVVLTATVDGVTGTGVGPTGTVSFYIAGSTPILIGTVSVGSAGVGVGTAVLSTSTLPDGALTIYAVYNGDANFTSGTSNQISVGLSDYTVAFIPQTLTIGQGYNGSALISLTTINGFPGSIVLGCNPAPNTLMTCSFNPTTLNGSGVSTLTVTTTAARKSVRGDGEQASLSLAGGATLAALLCWLLPGRKRRLPTLLLVLLALGLTVNIGCSANDFNAPAAVADTGTPLGTTLLTITTTGTSGSSTVRHNYTFQVTVQ